MDLGVGLGSGLELGVGLGSGLELGVGLGSGLELGVGRVSPPICGDIWAPWSCDEI